MKKDEAIELLGGTVQKAAENLGVTPQAIYAWPETLTERQENRVHAFLWRQSQSAKETSPAVSA